MVQTIKLNLQPPQLGVVSLESLKNQTIYSIPLQNLVVMTEGKLNKIIGVNPTNHHYNPTLFFIVFFHACRYKEANSQTQEVTSLLEDNGPWLIVEESSNNGDVVVEGVEIVEINRNGAVHSNALVVTWLVQSVLLIICQSLWVSPGRNPWKLIFLFVVSPFLCLAFSPSGNDGNGMRIQHRRTAEDRKPRRRKFG